MGFESRGHRYGDADGIRGAGRRHSNCVKGLKRPDTGLSDNYPVPDYGIGTFK